MPAAPLRRPAGRLAANGEALIHDAVAQLRAATGLRLVDDGPTSEAPTAERAAYQPDRYGNRWVPVLVAWVTAAENPELSVDIAGLGGSARVSWGDHPARYVTGMVQLDATKLSAIPDGAAGSTAAAESVILHELGHLVGLAHVDDPGQLMHPRGAVAAGYSAGDLAGLALLGSGDCAPWLRPRQPDRPTQTAMAPSSQATADPSPLRCSGRSSPRRWRRWSRTGRRRHQGVRHET